MAATVMLAAWATPHRSRGQGLEEETVTRQVNLTKDRVKPLAFREPISIQSFRSRYLYQIIGFRRLLPVERHIRRCVDTQRLISGEFHDRLDFSIEPSGKLSSFSVRGNRAQLQACLAPHVVALKFPAFKDRPSYTLQVLVGSTGARLGRETKATRPVDRYPIKTPEERKAYSMAIFWVFSPWSMAVGRCAEWVDQTVGYGFKISMATAIEPSGRPKTFSVEIKGKLASAAIDPFVSCVVPFIKAMRVPKHGGTDPFTYRHSTTTAGWGIR